jgi:hypothetical protein
MKKIELNQIIDDDYTPNVILDPETGECEISGDSYIDNAYTFYKDIIEWFEEFCSDTKRTLKLDIKLSYYNTSSTDCIYEILNIIKEFQDKGGKVDLKWHISEEDEDLEKEIKDFESYLNIHIEIVKVPEQP